MREFINRLFGFNMIDRLSRMPLQWNPSSGDARRFLTERYDEEDCWLQMNDFPDEPLWTVYFKGQAVDLEDTPVIWTINYPD